MKVTVLRLGHRCGRDERVSTHCGLVARALGADSIVYTGDKDDGLLHSVNSIKENWGGSFHAHYEESWKKVISEYKKKRFTAVHLTIYGEPLQKAIGKIRKHRKLLLIIGGEKVPPDVYQETDYNISVTGQPHSEVAALAVFLHEYFGGKELSKRFSGAKLRVVGQKKGKKVLKKPTL